MTLFGNQYTIKNGSVFFRHVLVQQADPASFQYLGGNWGRDARHVFVQSKVKQIDIASFEYLNPVYVKDANAAYDWTGSIKGADANSFEVLDPGVYVSEEIATTVWARGYARDCNAVYFHDQMFGRATALRGADPKTFISFRNDFGIDAKNVWFQKSKLAKADPKTWVYLGRGWSMDADRVFYGYTEVHGIDRTCFTIVAAPTIRTFATDGVRFLDADRLMDEQQFWAELSSELSVFEGHFRASYHKIRRTCTTCNGSGDCYCKRKGESDSANCARCGGTQKCHVCNGTGRNMALERL